MPSESSRFSGIDTSDLERLIEACKFRLEYDAQMGRQVIEDTRRLEFEMEDTIEATAEPVRKGVHRRQGDLF